MISVIFHVRSPQSFFVGRHVHVSSRRRVRQPRPGRFVLGNPRRAGGTPPGCGESGTCQGAGRASGLAQVVEQTFPPNGVMETAWKVEWDTVRGYGLVIKNAWF